MPTVNIPFVFEPWCKECPYLDQVSEQLRGKSGLYAVHTCSHVSVCRWAVASAHKMDAGGGTDV